MKIPWTAFEHIIVKLPILGERIVRPSPTGRDHWLWLSGLCEWYDCTSSEDEVIRRLTACS